MTYLLRLSACLFLCVSLNSFGALHIRDLDGDLTNGHEGVYDDVLDITWLADANYAQTSGYDDDGKMTLENASLWIEALTLSGDNWRLPISYPYNNYYRPGTLYYINGEMSELYYSGLGGQPGTSGTSIYTYSNENFSLFKNIRTSYYWTTTLAASYGITYEDNVIGFKFAEDISSGGQAMVWIESEFNSWPVHDGDIGNPVPLPAGIYLFLSGLVGLGLMRGRNG